MLRKRPCRICRRWFLPHPRAGARQRVCSGADCQRERHRRACADWHDRNAADDREDRLRRRITTIDAELKVELSPLAGLRLKAVRDAVGLEVSVVIEETSRVLGEWTRDAVRAQAAGIKREFARLLAKEPRDAIAGAPIPP